MKRTARNAKPDLERMVFDRAVLASMPQALRDYAARQPPETGASLLRAADLFAKCLAQPGNRIVCEAPRAAWAWLSQQTKALTRDFGVALVTQLDALETRADRMREEVAERERQADITRAALEMREREAEEEAAHA